MSFRSKSHGFRGSSLWLFVTFAFEKKHFVGFWPYWTNLDIWYIYYLLYQSGCFNLCFCIQQSCPSESEKQHMIHLLFFIVQTGLLYSLNLQSISLFLGSEKQYMIRLLVFIVLTWRPKLLKSCASILIAESKTEVSDSRLTFL